MSFAKAGQIFLPVPVQQSLDELSPSLPPEISIERVEKTELARGPDYPEVLQVVPQNESQTEDQSYQGHQHGRHWAQGGFLKHSRLRLSRSFYSVIFSRFSEYFKAQFPISGFKVIDLKFYQRKNGVLMLVIQTTD